MALTHPFRRDRAARRRLAAFTLTELLVVLAVITLLVSLRLPALARVKTQTWITQCSGNLRRVTLSFLLYGSENSGRLPNSSQGYWPWDLPASVSQAIAAYSGTNQRSFFFCPSSPYQSEDLFWNYSAPTYHITGYAYTFPGVASNGGGLFSTNYNPTVTPQQVAVPPVFGRYAVPTAAGRVLVADAEICAGPSYNPALPLTNYNFSDISDGLPAFPDGRHYRASHLAGSFPLGGNLGMLDGHVEWRPISAMIQRNNPLGSPGTPCFLW